MLFYGREFYDDIHVQEMDYAAQGMYLRLCWLCWSEGSIPADPERVARILKVDPDKFAVSAALILGCFQEGSPGRLIHPKVEKIRAEVDAFSEKKSRAGRLGNEIRWHGDRTAIAERPVCEPDASRKPIANVSPPSPSPNKEISPLLEQAFSTITERYPDATAVDQACREWISHCATGKVTEAKLPEIFEGLNRYNDSQKVADGFILSMDKWIRETRWNDHPKKSLAAVARDRAKESSGRGIDPYSEWRG